MAEQKTQPTTQSVKAFLENVEDEKVKADCFELVRIMEKATGYPAKMWGTAIVGFGQYHYKYDSGHEGDACLAGFSPRKQNISLYVMPGFADNTTLLDKLGKHKAAKGCLYIKKLADIDQSVLTQLIKQSVDYLKNKYPEQS
ncbi:DUF1801 domain-containing protein [Chitinophaga pinensis]|uniref:DUF1801 domain-containing protein n=1 Tax=Chitinophaga pinensis TaxID=79329 RepID=A0A5C6LMZ5_9BACT|nr:DUF1801 domain-containing protein [Chitinophaga pinensis]TWV95144.1 DUF1801 domain-containing protein [Chitinophaga pinensis]